MKKKLSKTAQKRKDQQINVMLAKKFEEKLLEKDRKEADKKDKIVHKPLPEKITNFNSTNFMDALKNSGLDSNSTTFADMERMINSNESIRELVDIKNIRMKTKVTEEQHHIIVILFNAYNTMRKRYGINVESWQNLLNEFIEIAPSIEGKRAEQFVTAHQALAQAVADANKGSSGAIREPNEMKN